MLRNLKIYGSIISIAIIILIILIAIHIKLNTVVVKPEPTQKTIPQGQAQHTSIQTSSTQIDETSVIYTNAEYGFSISLPKNGLVIKR